MGGGGAWSQDHDKILDHARDLQYDHVPGINLPAADASRETWTTAMDAFNDWKAREVAKESAGQAWWQTYKGGDEGGNGGGTGTSGPDSDNPDPGTGTGPYPDSNMYFPMLVPEYNDPKAQDWSQYMSQGGSGLLFQPWSQEYGEQYMQPNIWNYQPPELKVGRPKYFQNPLGIMDVTDYVPPSDDDDEMTEQEKIESGNYDGNPDSYGSYGMPAGSYGSSPPSPGEQGYLGYMARQAAISRAQQAALAAALADAAGAGSSGLEGGGQVSGNPADKGDIGNFG
jgi:hypothetical protein